MGRLLGLSILFVLIGAEAHASCKANFRGALLTATGQHHTIFVNPEPTHIAVGQPFSMEIGVCDKDNQDFSGTLKVDAHMPAHRHGMNYQPSLERTKEGGFQANGFLFHMPGRWQFIFILGGDNASERILMDYDVK